MQNDEKLIKEIFNNLGQNFVVSITLTHQVSRGAKYDASVYPDFKAGSFFNSAFFFFFNALLGVNNSDISRLTPLRMP